MAQYNNKGFTLVEIMIVVAIIALLAAFAIPAFEKSREDARKSACINNLRLLEHAKQQLATSATVMPGSTVPTFADLMPYIKGMTANGPLCRDGGVYTIGAITNPPSCSIHGTAPTDMLP